MPSVLFLFHVASIVSESFSYRVSTIAKHPSRFGLAPLFRATVTDTVSGEFGYASVQGPVRAKRYGNQLEFAQSDKILAGDVFPSEESVPYQP